jgi:CubicO group peptidase (beta-lactamase class C family)
VHIVHDRHDQLLGLVDRRRVLGMLAGAGVLLGLGHRVRATAAGTSETDEPVPSTPTPDEWQAFAEFVRERGDAAEFGGVVLVAAGGDPVVQEAHGLANRESERPNTVTTAFNTASVGKTFTAVAVAQLVEQGQLSFQDPIGEYVHGFPADVASTVTIDHLLTHTSGMGDFTQPGQPYPQAARSAVTATDLLPLITDAPLMFEPGSQVGYSNSGYVVLGAIVEAVSGEPYFDYVTEHVFGPARMTSTDWAIPGTGDGDRATAYMVVDEDGRPLPLPGPDGGGQPAGERRLADASGVLPWGNPAGGAYATVGDLQRFGASLLGHRLLGAELTEVLLAGKVPGQRGDRWSYGFTDETIGGVRIVGKGGGAPGVAAVLDLYPDLDYVVVILANYDGVLAPIHDRTREIMTS